MRLITALLASLMLLPAFVTQAFAEPTIADVFKTWDARQEALGSLEVTVAGTLHLPRINRGHSEFEIVLQIQGSNGNIRAESTTVEFYANGNRGKTTRKIIASNDRGAVRSLTYRDDRAVPEGSIELAGYNGSPSDAPVYLACRFGMLPFRSHSFHHMASADPSNGNELRLDLYPFGCVNDAATELQLTSRPPAASLYFDRETFRIHRLSFTPNGQPRGAVLLRYGEPSYEPWFPSSWEISSLDDEGKTTEHYNVRVTKFVKNPAIPQDVFDLKFPADAIVYSHNATGGFYARAAANGQLERISDEEAAIALSAPPKRGNSVAPTVPAESGFLRGVPLLAKLGFASMISLGSLGVSLAGLCFVEFSDNPRRRLALLLGAVSVLVGLGMAALLRDSPLSVAAWASLSGVSILFGVLTMFAAVARSPKPICGA